MWLKSAETKALIIDDVVRRVADIVRPFPVAWLRLSDDCIVAVDDRYFQPHHNDVLQNLQTHQRNISLHHTFSTSPFGLASLAAPQYIGQGTTTTAIGSTGGDHDEGHNGSHQSSEVERGGSPNDLSSDSPNDNRVATKDRSIALGSRDEEKFPFIGILTLEDSAGNQQAIKIVVCIKVKTSSRHDSVVTAVSMDNFRFLLPSPQTPVEHSVSTPQTQHFRCLRLSLSIGPDLSESKICEPIYQHPEMNWYVTKIALAREINVGVTPVIGLTPAIQAPVSVKFGSTIDYIALSLFIDFKNAHSVEVRSTREHSWGYPMRKSVPNGTDITLPCHTSKTMYSKPACLTTVRTCAEAILELNRKSRPKNIIRKSRAEQAPFNIGDAKHLLMKFSVIFKKRDGDQFLEFDGPGSVTELSHKINPNAQIPVTETSISDVGSRIRYGEGTVSMHLQSNPRSHDIYLSILE